MRLRVQLDVNSKLAQFTGKTAAVAQRAAERAANRALKYAQENVREGVGPGPHPHLSELFENYGWEYEDTGRLRRSLKVFKKQQGFMARAGVFTDVEYGAHLEVGWHSHLNERREAISASNRAGLAAGSQGFPVVSYVPTFHRYPWLAPAFARVARELSEIAGGELRRFMTEAGGGKTVTFSHDAIESRLDAKRAENMFGFTPAKIANDWSNI